MGIASQLNTASSQVPSQGPASYNAGTAQASYPGQQYQNQPQYPTIHQYPTAQPSGGLYPVINHAQSPNPGQNFQPQTNAGSFYSTTAIQNKLQTLVKQNGLEAFYSNQRVFELAQTISRINFAQLAERWKLPPQMALDLVGLGLYDTVIMVDDSASMRFAEEGERIQDMKAILERISSVCGLLDTDGIAVHTMNGDFYREHIKYSQEAADFVRQIRFEGATPLGTMIHQKLLVPYVYSPARRRALRKPIHIIVITDGEPTGESSSQVRSAIARCKDFLKSSSPYGAGGAAFQFAQVGLDQKAQAFLSKLDNDSKVGRMVDCTSAYELEQTEYLQRSGIHLTPDMYLNKLCLGAIDRSYDEQDEGPTQKKSFFKRLLA